MKNKLLLMILCVSLAAQAMSPRNSRSDADLKEALLFQPDLIVLIQKSAPDNDDLLKKALGLTDQQLAIARKITPEEIAKAQEEAQKQREAFSEENFKKQMDEYKEKQAQKQKAQEQLYLANKNTYDGIMDNYLKALESFFSQFKNSLNKEELTVWNKIQNTFTQLQKQGTQDQAQQFIGEKLGSLLIAYKKKVAQNPAIKDIINLEKADIILFALILNEAAMAFLAQQTPAQ